VGIVRSKHFSSIFQAAIKDFCRTQRNRGASARKAGTCSNSTTFKGNDMNRNFASALVTGAAALAAALACGSAFADEPEFVSTLTREEVNAELKKPYPGGDPWSGRYNMFPTTPSTTLREQVEQAYMASRDEVNALNAEDSGSAYFLKSSAPLAANPGTAMGGPAR
jgi:hypothetical protein